MGSMTKATDAIHSTAANARAVLNKGTLGCCVAERLEAGLDSGREALWRAHASQAAAHRASVPTAQAARSAKLGEACK